VRVVIIDDPAAAAVFSQLEAKLSDCYRSALSQDASAEAAWASSLVRDGSGRVTSVDIPGAPYPELRSCIAAAIKAQKFPAPKQPGASETFFVYMPSSKGDEDFPP
jgi:hypothetical protein